MNKVLLADPHLELLLSLGHILPLQRASLLVFLDLLQNRDSPL